MTKFRLITLLIMMTSVLVQSVMPSDGLSLAFVIDMTRSMTDDLKQIQQGTEMMLEKFLNMGTRSPIKDYVLQVFRDPRIEDPIQTKDPEKFKAQLKLLYPFASNIKGCYEKCLSGITSAIPMVRNGSTVYVFTDATSRDYHKYDDLLLVLQSKQIKVVFIVTGHCGDIYHAGFQVFYKLAKGSGGQVFYMESSFVLEFMKSLMDTIGSADIEDEVELVTNSSGKSTEFKVKPEDLTLNIQVTVNNPSENVGGTLYNPDGKAETEKDGLKVHFKKSKNIYFVTKANPQPGKWVLKLATKSKDFTRKISIVKNETLVEQLKAAKQLSRNFSIRNNYDLYHFTAILTIIGFVIRII